MPDQFQLAVEHGAYLRQLYGARNTMMDTMVDMYLMNWPEESKVKQVQNNVRVTKSPDARNAVMGAVRLLISQDPVFSVPHEKNALEIAEARDKIERAAGAILAAAGRVRGEPVHYDVVLSMILFGETHIAVTKTADMLEQAKGANKGHIARLTELAESTPFMFDCWDPRTGYPEFGTLGLSSFYREVKIKSGSVIDDFGSKAKGQIGESRYQDTTLCHYWDGEWRFTWINGQAEPLVAEQHGLPFIPVVCAVGEGSRLFGNPEDQRQPFLYTVWKSDLWSRQNMLLTIMMTHAYGIGSNPIYVAKLLDKNEDMNIDFSNPGGMLRLNVQENVEPLVKQVIDPSLRELMELTSQGLVESTIYKQTLGGEIGASAAYSMVALLHQAGRLPLVVPQRKAGNALADAAKMAIKWAKYDGEVVNVKYGNIMAHLQPKDVEENFELECKLDINLPQDRLQMANVANLLTQGQKPMVSQRWAREEVLGIGQSDRITEEIWGEQAADMAAQLYIAQQQMQVDQARQMALQGAMQGGQPGGPGMPPGGPGMPPGGPGGPPQVGSPDMVAQTPGLPPEMSGAPPTGMAGPGLSGPVGIGERGRAYQNQAEAARRGK